jgi:hypothetical protein
MNYKEAIEAIKANYPPENYSILREALDLAIIVLQEKVDESVNKDDFKGRKITKTKWF